MVTKFVTLPTDARIDQAVEALIRTTQHEFPVLDGSGALAGILTRDELIGGLREHGAQASVADVMHRDIPVVRQNEGLDRAFKLMQDCQCPGLGVVDGDGRLVGLITPEAVGEMLMISSVLPRDATPSWRTPSRAGDVV
jgi:stage IV sporulation protein FB